jgi:hypothetical protein
MEGLVLAHRHRPMRHAHRQRRALLAADRAHRFLKSDIERVLATIGGATITDSPLSSRSSHTTRTPTPPCRAIPPYTIQDDLSPPNLSRLV